MLALDRQTKRVDGRRQLEAAAYVGLLPSRQVTFADKLPIDPERDGLSILVDRLRRHDAEGQRAAADRAVEPQHEEASARGGPRATGLAAAEALVLGALKHTRSERLRDARVQDERRRRRLC